MHSFTTLTLTAALATSVLASSHGKGAHVERRSQPQWIKRRAAGNDRRAVGSDSSLSVVANSTTWYNGTALWFEATGGQSACYTVTTDTDFVVGLGTDLWPDAGATVSPLCGQSMFIQNTLTGANVTVSIQDASGKNYTTLSKAAFSALGDLDVGMLPVQYFVFNGTTNFTSAALAAVVSSSSTPSVAVVTATTTHHTHTVASTTYTPTTTSSSSEYTPTTTSIDYAAIAAASSVSAAAEWASESSASAASAWAAEQAASSASAASAWAAEQYASSTSAAAAAVVAAAAPTATASSSSGSGDWQTGGSATYFYQNGVAGACGTVHADTDYVAALYTSTYSGGSNCGRQIQLVNDAGASVTVTVADECPTCDGPNYVDLSVSAFLALGTEAQGMVPMKWQFLD